MKSRYGEPDHLLPPTQRQRLAGWISMLDVDLELAQRTLRLPLHQLPLPPIAVPAIVDAAGVVLVAALEPAGPAPAPVVGLRGAYARRAARRATDATVTPVIRPSD